VRVTPQPGASDPAPASDVEAAPFQAIHRTLREVVPEALVAPALLVGTSDARHYGGVTDQIYGFRPIRLGAADLGRFHGTDERVAVTDLVRSVRFFARLIETTAGASSP
jgi:carboxypeptidase PM20D1